MRLGIWRPPGIGDVLLLAPTLQALRAVFPTMEIALWGQIDAATILLMAGLCDEAHDIDKGFRPQTSLDAFLGFEWKPIELLEMAESFGIQEAVCVPVLTQQGHQARYFHWAASRLFQTELPWMEEVLDLPCPPVELEWAGSTLIYGHSSTPAKNWPMDRYLTLARLLEEEGHRVVFVESPGVGYREDIPYPVLTRTLFPMAYLQCQARLWIGNDTGPTHLAALLGCPTLAIFGGSHAPTWHPLTDGARWLQTCPRQLQEPQVGWCHGHDCWSGMTVGYVLDAVRALSNVGSLSLPPSVT